MLESLNYSFRNPKKHNLSNLPHQTVEKLQKKNNGVLRGPQLNKQRWRARLGILRVNFIHDAGCLSSVSLNATNNFLWIKTALLTAALLLMVCVLYREGFSGCCKSRGRLGTIVIVILVNAYAPGTTRKISSFVLEFLLTNLNIFIFLAYCKVAWCGQIDNRCLYIFFVFSIPPLTCYERTW